MDIEPFSWDDLHDLLTSNFEKTKSLTMAELRQPTAFMVQKIYFTFLQEFGASDSLLQLPFEMLQELEHHEVLGPCIPVLALQAAISSLLEKLFDTTDFGVSDLVNPQPKRTQKWLTVFTNFWMFCSNQMESVSRVLADVDEKTKKRAELDQIIEDKKRRINELTTNAAQEKADKEVYLEKIAEEEEKMKHLVEKSKEMNEYAESLRRQLLSKEEVFSNEKEKLKNLEIEKENLEGLFEHAALMTKLEKDLNEAHLELQNKTERKLELRKNALVLERLSEEYAEVQEIVKNLVTEKNTVRSAESKLRDNKKKESALNIEIEEKDNRLREKELLWKKRNDEFQRLTLQWNLKKNGKEEEVRMLQEQVDGAKKMLGEEELVIVDLREQIHEAKTVKDAILLEIESDTIVVRQKYSKLREALEKYNRKLREDMKRIEGARIKVQGAPGAL